MSLSRRSRRFSLICWIPRSRWCWSSSSFFFSVLRARSSRSLRENILMSTTMPSMPGGALRLASRTSPAFSPKIAFSSRSSGVSSVSPFGVILPTRMSPAFTWAPMRTMPSSSRFGEHLLAHVRDLARDLLLPAFVSRTCVSNSSMWIDVNMSSLTSLSLMMIASSKLYPRHGMNAHSTLRPSASSPFRGGGAVRDHLALPDLLPDLDDRFLVDAGVLVRAEELDELVLVDAA